MKQILNDNCIFCKIIEKQSSCYKIAETKYAIAFLDISNDTFGHTLVIPKSHCENIIDCDKKILSETINLVQQISKHYMQDLGFSGINILNANGVAAEQSVMHLHFHIIPRKEKDNLKIWPNLPGCKVSLQDAQKILSLEIPHI